MSRSCAFSAFCGFALCDRSLDAGHQQIQHKDKYAKQDEDQRNWTGEEIRHTVERVIHALSDVFLQNAGQDKGHDKRRRRDIEIIHRQTEQAGAEGDKHTEKAAGSHVCTDKADEKPWLQ